jgi:hypothetical protein
VYCDALPAVLAGIWSSLAVTAGVLVNRLVDYQVVDVRAAERINKFCNVFT